jgi:nucleoside-diphosphate-sugar epimerase
MDHMLLSVGHGYCADHLGRALAPRGWRVAGTTRDAARAAALCARGIEAQPWPGSDLAPMLARATHLLLSAPPRPATADAPARDPLLAAHADLLAARQSGPRPLWIGYLSTIGVYGDHQGAWVDEDTPPTPDAPRTRARLAAEDEWRALGAHVFRLGGIYGPGRAPFAALRDGTARRIVKPGQVFSRIHVADITAALLASIAQPAPGRVYNLVDNEPCPPQDVVAHAANLIGVTPPPEQPFEAAEISPMMRSFYAACKRTSNARMRAELVPELAYPTYREGLAALVQEEPQP